jgi:hypothetical protein
VVACIQRRQGAARRFTPAVDMWAAGASLFLMLGGYPPFDGGTTVDVFNDILHGHVTFSEPSWEAVSPRAKKLIENLMQRDPKRRCTASRAMASDWIVNPPPDPKALARSRSGGGGGGNGRGSGGVAVWGGSKEEEEEKKNSSSGSGGGGDRYGTGGLLEESSRGLARYHRRSSGGRDLNLSGSVQRESTMLQLQEKHDGSRGHGLNESLRRIFGMNKKRLPAAAINEREKRGDAPARDSTATTGGGGRRAPTMQQGHVGHTFMPGSTVAPPPQNMMGGGWVAVAPGGDGANTLAAALAAAAAPSSISQHAAATAARAAATAAAERASQAQVAAAHAAAAAAAVGVGAGGGGRVLAPGARAPGWGSGTSTPVGFTPEMQRRMYANQPPIVGVGGPGGWLGGAGAGAGTAPAGFATGHLAPGSPDSPIYATGHEPAPYFNDGASPAPAGHDPFVNYAAMQAAAAQAQAHAVELCTLNQVDP